MLLRLACSSSCFFRNSHMFTKFQRVKSFRFHDSAADNKYQKLSTLCNVESKYIRGSSKLLAIHTWRINNVPTRNYIKFDTESKPALRSNPRIDGLSSEKYELIYVNDSMLVYQRSIHMVILLVVLISPWLGYQVYRDPEVKDVNFRKPLDNSWKFLNLFGGIVFFLLTLGLSSRFCRSPYRLYKERISHGRDLRYLAILPARIFFSKQLQFGILEYKALPKPQRFTQVVLFGNANIKNKGYVVFEDCFLSPHFQNELNGHTSL
ncbi:uncharacterized protein LOC110443230 isoform X1 [Mizuhopecten yessoensis]|uniref:uncharacterized protein LOC110443230 isoform X1 n=1 Tax=Mizuhopecten yessoensis TaxID=6573 RepID=UPI000B458CD6|nr:uncharacterized protein LOC110443230 isoform X1 [Mizuhopecten yessoensis]